MKTLMTETLRSRYAEVDQACVIDITRLNVADTIRFRRLLRAKSMRVSVVKNSMARRAFAGGALEPLGRSLEGPCALVTGGDSAIEVAKECQRLSKELPLLGLKLALLAGDSEVMSLMDAASLKGHRELLADISGLISSPGRALAGCLSSPQGKIAGCLKAMVEKEEAA